MFAGRVEFGIVKIEPIGLAWAVGFLFGLWLAVRRAEKVGFSPQSVINLSVLMFFSAFLGAKIFFLAFHWREFAANPTSFLYLNMSGSGAFGAVLLSIPVAILYLRKRTQNVWQVLDILTPSWAFIVGLGRLGCHASGCCFGMPTKSAFGMIFLPDSPAGSAFPGQALVPTQLLSAVKGFSLFGLILLAERKKNFPGQTFCTMLFFYSVGRFFIDFYRYYESDMFLFSVGSYNVPATQVIALALAVAAIAVGQYLGSRQPSKGRRNNSIFLAYKTMSHSRGRSQY